MGAKQRYNPVSGKFDLVDESPYESGGGTDSAILKGSGSTAGATNSTAHGINIVINSGANGGHGSGSGHVIDGNRGCASGRNNTVVGDYGNAQNYHTDATGLASHASGYGQNDRVKAVGIASFAHYWREKTDVELLRTAGAIGDYSTVLGTVDGLAEGAKSGLFAGNRNIVKGKSAVIVGGVDSEIRLDANRSIILGGITNIIDTEVDDAVIVAGANSIITGGVDGRYSAIVGGINHTVSKGRVAVVGGDGHIVDGINAVALGGAVNEIYTNQSTIISGFLNVINGETGVIIGSEGCTISPGVSRSVIMGMGNKTADRSETLYAENIDTNGLAVGTTDVATTSSYQVETSDYLISSQTHSTLGTILYLPSNAGGNHLAPVDGQKLTIVNKLAQIFPFTVTTGLVGKMRLLGWGATIDNVTLDSNNSGIDLIYSAPLGEWIVTNREGTVTPH